ncbi:MAG TPA: phosphatase PAP2 family protein [Ferruginibacter sp.]|nr:phosphatase PAP2 family protein [Ferruginibacter sp.]HPH89949.1 phosphatase PAP2 family protein [Ferruginibacter sp.]
MESLFNMQWDKTVLWYVNHRWQNPFFDWLLPAIRNAELWTPLYLFLILFVLINYKKTGWWWVLAAVCTPILADLISSHLIKEYIIRVRPCNEPALAGWLRMYPGIYRPQSSSFTSSHATSHFGMAMYLFLTLKQKIGRSAWLFFAWAAAICYAQMYVGVHYPLDLIGGAIVGSMIGYTTATVFNKNKVLE